jgi:hypothetical protein
VSTALKRQTSFHNCCESVSKIRKRSREHPSTNTPRQNRFQKAPLFFTVSGPGSPTPPGRIISPPQQQSFLLLRAGSPANVNERCMVRCMLDYLSSGRELHLIARYPCKPYNLSYQLTSPKVTVTLANLPYILGNLFKSPTFITMAEPVGLGLASHGKALCFGKRRGRKNTANHDMSLVSSD